MGWMSELTGETSHKGQVVVTLKSGVSTTYVDLEKAEEACGDLKGSLTYFRGAFFQSGASRRADAAVEKAAEKSETPPPPPPAEEKPRRRSRTKPESSTED